MINAVRDRFQGLEGSFRWLLASDALTFVAMMVGQVALPWWVTTAGGARDLATYSVVTCLFAVLAMPVMSPVGDRIVKRRLIRTALVALALASASVAALASVGVYDLRAIAMIGLVPALAMAALTPAVGSFVTELVRPVRLADAFSLQQCAQATGRLIGPALGGAVLGMVGIAPSLWLGAVLLSVAAWTARHLPTGVAPVQSHRSWREDFAAGMRANWRVPIERGWIAVNFASWIFLFPAFTMLVPVKVQSLGLSGAWFGLCEAGLSLGMLCGALGCSAWCVARVGRFRARVGAAALQGAALACAGATETGLCLVVCFAVAGFLEVTIALVGQTHRMLARPQVYRARMVAGTVMTTYVAGVIGSALAGAALLHVDVRGVFMAFGMLGALAAFCLVAVPGVRTFMALNHESVADYYRRQFPAAFDDGS